MCGAEALYQPLSGRVVQHLGGHEVQGAHRHKRHLHVLFDRGAKVCEPHGAVSGQEDVVRLDVAVHNRVDAVQAVQGEEEGAQDHGGRKVLVQLPPGDQVLVHVPPGTMFLLARQ